MQTQLVNVLGADVITAIDETTDIVYVAMKPLVDAMGLDWNSQREKAQNDERFNYRLIPMVGLDSKIREMGSLALDHLPAFLYSINPNKVRKDLRDTIIAFQYETFGVINAYWRNKRKAETLHVKDSTEPDMLGVILKLVENQQRQSDAILDLVGEIKKQNSTPQIAPSPYLDSRSRRKLRDAITARAKEIAQELHVSMNTIAPSIWIELKRFFDVDDYQDLEQSQMRDVMNWVMMYEAQKRPERIDMSTLVL